MAAGGGFVRKDRTWLAYGALATFAYCLYGLGPVLAFLHAGLHLSYLVTSLHTTVWSAGALLSGWAYPRLSHRLGRRRVFWAAAAVSSAGALLFVLGRWLAVTLLAAALLGMAGTTVLTGTTAILADEHGTLRDRALIESNAGASACAVLAPAVIGGLAATPLGWRAGMAVPVVAFGLLWLRFRGLRLAPAPGPAAPPAAGAAPNVPASTAAPAASEPGAPAEAAAPPLTAPGATGPPVPGHLPGRFWVRAALVGAVVAIEFCLVFQAALLLHAQDALSTRRAAAALSVFLAGELAGRIGGSLLARAAGRGPAIIGAALAVTAIGFLTFWLSRQLGAAVAGLGVAGLGVANLYPFSLAQAVGAAPGRTDLAAGRAQLVIGVATTTMPFALGALASWTGVGRAYLIEPVLIAAAVVLLLAGNRAPAPSVARPGGGG